MSAGTVQFRGVDNVIQAYVYKNVACWSMWQGKALLHKYQGGDLEEGKDQLAKWLQMMNQSSNAIYTLKIYEDLDENGKIKENTPCDGSFNFRLNMDDQIITNSQYMALGSRNDTNERLARIEAMLAGDDDEEEDDGEELEEELDTIGKVQKVLETPLVSGILGKLFNIDITKTPGATMGNAPGSQTTSQDEKINQAIAILKAKDKNFADNLTKLAELAKNNPLVYQMAIAKLNSL